MENILNIPLSLQHIDIIFSRYGYTYQPQEDKVYDKFGNDIPDRSLRNESGEVLLKGVIDFLVNRTHKLGMYTGIKEGTKSIQHKLKEAIGISDGK